jgi:hypothetical protein
MFDVRFKLPELMEKRGLKNAYALMKASKGALTITTAMRLVEAGENPKRLDMKTLDTLCAIFELKDMNRLIARD